MIMEKYKTHKHWQQLEVMQNKRTTSVYISLAFPRIPKKISVIGRNINIIMIRVIRLWTLMVALTARTGAISASSRNTPLTFILNSGASHHMVYCKEWITNQREIRPLPIVLSNGRKVYWTQTGIVYLGTHVGNPQDQYESVFGLYDALYVPNLHSNFVSCSKICDTGYQISFRRNGKCSALENGVLKFQGKLQSGVSHIKASPLLN